MSKVKKKHEKVYSNNLTSTHSSLYTTAYFKTHTVMEFDETGAPHQVVMLENKHDGKVVAINKDADNVIAKVHRHITSISIPVTKCNKSVRLKLHLK